MDKSSLNFCVDQPRVVHTIIKRALTPIYCVLAIQCLPPPVQPPMLYIKMCVFKFYFRFRVAAFEIWCTTFRKFEKTYFEWEWGSVFHGSVNYIAIKPSLTKFVTYRLKTSIALPTKLTNFDYIWLFNYSCVK